jgi:altronate dehydratase large subunit
MIAKGYLRSDGRKGIRNVLIVAYLVECAHHVARRIVEMSNDPDVHLVGFPGCYPNDYALRMMRALSTHPNVGGVLLLSLGCEGFNREDLGQHVAASGRVVETVVIQQAGGTRSATEQGLAAARRIKAEMNQDAVRTPFLFSDLVVGTICGGSDGTSGITANPAVGRAFDRLIGAGATCIFEETGEMIGCEGPMGDRAASPEVAEAIRASIAKAEAYYRAMGYGSFAPGNAEGGLSSQEEKSAGAYVKSGHMPINGVIKPADIPPFPGLYLLDVVPDGNPKFGFPNISDNAEIVELMACGAHLTLFTTGRGSVVGSAIAPVIKVTGNPDTYRHMSEDMDINAGRVLEGLSDLDQVADEIVALVEATVRGQQTKSEELGHREFILTYKTFEPTGPSCLPRSAHAH